MLTHLHKAIERSGRNLGCEVQFFLGMGTGELGEKYAPRRPVAPSVLS